MSPKASHSPLSAILKAAAWFATAALALAGCEDRVAGTSVGTGNPTEIEVAFRDDAGGPVALTGTLQVYAATQIPVPGFAPEPLISVEVAGETSASLKADALAGLADSLWPKSSIEDGAYAFNIVVAGATQGAILKGFAFRKDSPQFVLSDGDDKAEVRGDIAEVQGTVAPLVDIECAIDTNSLSSTSDWDYYLFVYGTGYVAKGTSGSFVFHGIPGVNHDVFFIPVPGKDNPGGAIDSLDIYNMKAGIEPGAVNAIQIGDIQTTLPIPESLKTK